MMQWSQTAHTIFILLAPFVINVLGAWAWAPPFSFPTYHPSTSTPQAPFENKPNRRDCRLVRAPFEVSDNGVSSRVMVLAESLRRAEEVLRSKYPEGEVRLVFPLDGEHIFAGHDESKEIEGQDLLS
jgi:hypothetical protein